MAKQKWKWKHYPRLWTKMNPVIFISFFYPKTHVIITHTHLLIDNKTRHIKHDVYHDDDDDDLKIFLLNKFLVSLLPFHQHLFSFFRCFYFIDDDYNFRFFAAVIVDQIKQQQQQVDYIQCLMVICPNFTLLFWHCCRNRHRLLQYIRPEICAKNWFKRN